MPSTYPVSNPLPTRKAQENDEGTRGSRPENAAEACEKRTGAGRLSPGRD